MTPFSALLAALTRGKLVVLWRRWREPSWGIRRGYYPQLSVLIGRRSLDFCWSRT